MTKFTTPKDLAFLKFFNELPSPIKEWAIENMENNIDCDSLLDILNCGFVWKRSPQGHDYWQAITYMIMDNQPITNPVHLLPNDYKFEEVKVISAELIPVKACQDDSGHWYVIPNDLNDEFHKDLENEDMSDSGEFDNKYGQYRTNGDLNNIQLFANQTKTTQL